MAREARHGAWLSGAHAGHPAAILGVRAGLLVTVDDAGRELRGAASDFRAANGLTGNELLHVMLPSPSVARLRAGAVREALAAAHALAIFGRTETRAFEYADDGALRYLADDCEGGRAMIAFDAGELVAAAVSLDPFRAFDVPSAIRSAPPSSRSLLQATCEDAFFWGVGTKAPLVTAVAWSIDGVVVTPEPWHAAYTFGLEIFADELVDDDEWRRTAAARRRLSAAVAERIVAAARGPVPTPLAAEDIAVVVPSEAPHRAEALEQLASSGFVVERDAPADRVTTASTAETTKRRRR